jgi:hypothetical protein
VLFVLFLIFGIVFLSPWLWLVAPLHAMVAIQLRREDRKHRELIDAIERHGPPPGWRS